MPSYQCAHVSGDLIKVVSVVQVLALELLKVLLENSGKVFQASEKFTGAIKQYLCLSLLKNASSPVPVGRHILCHLSHLPAMVCHSISMTADVLS